MKDLLQAIAVALALCAWVAGYVTGAIYLFGAFGFGSLLGIFLGIMALLVGSITTLALAHIWAWS